MPEMRKTLPLFCNVDESDLELVRTLRLALRDFFRIIEEF